MKIVKQIIDNSYIHIAGILAIFLSPFADAIGKEAYWWLFGFLFILFIFGLITEIKKRRDMKNATINLPVVIKVDEGPDVLYVMNNLVDKIEEKTGLDGYSALLQKYHSINVETFIFEYEGSIYDFDRLVSFARIIRYNVKQIEKQLNGKVKFHVAYYKRPAVGFLLGTIFRTEAITVYQNSDYENRFYPVAEVVNRSYKERVDKFRKYDIQSIIKDPSDKRVLIAIESASHNIKVNAKIVKNFSNSVFIRLKEKGTIAYECDWIEYAAEIYNVINKMQVEYEKITLVHAMPEAIAVVLGMALENYWNIEITQYDNGEYKNVYNIQKVKLYN